MLNTINPCIDKVLFIVYAVNIKRLFFETKKNRPALRVKLRKGGRLMVKKYIVGIGVIAVAVVAMITFYAYKWSLERPVEAVVVGEIRTEQGAIYTLIKINDNDPSISLRSNIGYISADTVAIRHAKIGDKITVHLTETQVTLHEYAITPVM